MQLGSRWTSTKLLYFVIDSKIKRLLWKIETFRVTLCVITLSFQLLALKLASNGQSLSNYMLFISLYWRGQSTCLQCCDQIICGAPCTCTSKASVTNAKSRLVVIPCWWPCSRTWPQYDFYLCDNSKTVFVCHMSAIRQLYH